MAREQESIQRIFRNMQMKHATITTVGIPGAKGKKIDRPKVRKKKKLQTISKIKTYRRL